MVSLYTFKYTKMNKISNLLFSLCLSFSAQAADINLIIDILECESSGKHDVHGDAGASYGIAQFQRPTFNRFVKQAGFKQFYYENPIHQLRVMNWAIDNGYGAHWTCYTKIQQRDTKRTLN